MEGFSWIIIIMIVFGLIGKISKKFMQTEGEDQQQWKPQRPRMDTRMPEATEFNGEDQTADFGDRRTSYEIERNRGTANQSPIEQQEINPYSREESTPYSREELTAYEREELTPYEREKLIPYQRSKRPPDQANSGETKVPAFSRLTKKQWAEGIVLAEVLNEPRAKRPHQTAGRYRNNPKG